MRLTPGCCQQDTVHLCFSNTVANKALKVDEALPTTTTTTTTITTTSSSSSCLPTTMEAGGCGAAVAQQSQRWTQVCGSAGKKVDRVGSFSTGSATALDGYCWIVSSGCRLG